MDEENPSADVLEDEVLNDPEVSERFSLRDLRNALDWTDLDPVAKQRDSCFREYAYIGIMHRGIIMAIGCAFGHTIVTLVFGDAWYYSSWVSMSSQKTLGGITVAVDVLSLPVLAYGVTFRDSRMGQWIEKYSQTVICIFLCNMVTCHLLVAWILEVRECDTKLSFQREEHLLTAWPTMTMALFPHMYTLTVFIAFLQCAGLFFKSLVYVDIYVLFLVLMRTSSVLYCQELNRVTAEFFFINLSQIMVSMFIGACRCYEIEVTQRVSFRKLLEAQSSRLATEKALGVLLPKRLRRLESEAPTGLVVEPFSQVTVMFCRFCLVERDQYSREELDVFGRCMLQFDSIIKRHKLFKVEHIGEDLLIGSPLLRNAPDASAQQQEADALTVVLAAHELMDACAKIVREFEVTIHFAVGVHSGPIAGALAGRLRRFYRLFGTTLNTAARLCQDAPDQRVHISQTTREMLQGLDHCLWPQGTKSFKGLDDMETYFVSSPHASDRDAGRQPLLIKTLEKVLEAMTDSRRWTFTGARKNTTDELQCTGHVRSQTWPAPAGSHIGHELRTLHANCTKLSSRPKSRSIDVRTMHRFEGSDGSNSILVPTTLSSEMSSEIGELVDAYAMHFSGRFVDAAKEKEYAEKGVSVNALKKYLMLLFLIHLVSFPTMILASFRQLEFKNRDDPFQSTEIVGTSVIGLLLVSFHAIALYLVHASMLASNRAALQQIVLACSILSSMGTLGASMTASFGFGFVGILFFISIHKQVTSSLLEPALLVWVPIATSIVFQVSTRWWGDKDWRVNFYHEFVLVYYAVIVVYPFNWLNSWLLSVHQRKSWAIHQQSLESEMKLHQCLLNIIPSTSIAAFVRDRQLHMDETAMAHVGTNALANHLKPNFWMFPEDQAVVLRYDLAGFTNLCLTLDPKQVVTLLHELWCLTDSLLYATKYEDVDNRFDANKHFKLNTIGDCYVVAEPFCSEQSAMKEFIVSKMIVLGISIMRSLREYIRTDQPHLGVKADGFAVRMGIACDVCTSGVWGLLKPRYDVLGKAMKMAKAAEEDAEYMTIRLCDVTSNMLTNTINRHNHELLSDFLSPDELDSELVVRNLQQHAVQQISEVSEAEVSIACNRWMADSAINVSTQQTASYAAGDRSMISETPVRRSMIRVSIDRSMDAGQGQKVVLLGNPNAINSVLPSSLSRTC